MDAVRAAVVGTGLIGGSVLLRLVEAGVPVRGWDPDPDTRRYGRERGVDFPDDLARTVRDAGVVFLAGPLVTLPATVAEVAAAAPVDCVLTDVGSTKSAVAVAARRHGLTGRFVPGHPMAGTERAGLAAARPELLRGATWVLCPDQPADLGPFRRLARLLMDVFAARVTPMSPEAHDEAAALASHVPHVLARALAGAAGRSPVRDSVRALAAGSFRDGTRVAGTPSRRTADMLLGNRAAVLEQLTAVRAYLDELAAAVEADDAPVLTRLLAEARALRVALPAPPDRPALPARPGRPALTDVTGPDAAPEDVAAVAERLSFSAPDGAEELAWLLGLGASGGWLTGCEPGLGTVTWTARRLRPPDRSPVDRSPVDPVRDAGSPPSPGGPARAAEPGQKVT
ncbi:prephenate dehydrogenase [Plantactinospora siamensis]|uniref:Prephenate dehydrogenase n=1 Tax=Plantactinospora siamensis TaxID=555372 RepID=A0ABV6NX37_9ACTN